MRVPYKDPFTSYIGTPVVALAHVPFLALDHDITEIVRMSLNSEPGARVFPN